MLKSRNSLFFSFYMPMYNITTYYWVKYLFQNTFRKIRFFDLAGLGPVVFWWSKHLVQFVLVELSVVELPVVELMDYHFTCSSSLAPTTL
jgi:hypothetical protein